MNDRRLAALSLFVLLAVSAHAQSFLTTRPEDPRAVYVAAPTGDADQTAILQAAIDRVQSSPSHHGIVFIPEGRYLLSDTLHVWNTIRLIGYGAHRPVLVLAPHTPGFDGQKHRYLVIFNASRPANRNTPLVDGNSDTFHSAMSNIDITIGDGNPSAVAVRFHIAQHCFLSHMRIDTGSGFAAIEEAGNVLNDLEILHGDYGVITATTAPSWPWVLMDSHLSGQRIAALDSWDARSTYIRLSIDHVPTAIKLDQNHFDHIVLQDSSFSDISGPAISLVNAENARMGLHVKDLLCTNVPKLLTLPGHDPTAAPGPIYVVSQLSFGLELAPNGSELGMNLHVDQHAVNTLPPAPPTDIAPLPDSATWVNLRSFDAKGDGSSDDTSALERALASHKPIYVPQGSYMLSRTVTLPPDTILIGLHSNETRFTLADHSRSFDNPAHPQPIFTTTPGGAPRLSGIGLATGDGNDGAVALLWQAGEHSLLDDFRFHGTGNYSSAASWDRQAPSLIVHGGGGTLRDLWIPTSTSTAGLQAEHTSVPTHIYLLSVEHHVRHEVLFDDVHHWNIFAAQTEEDGAQKKAMSIHIANSSDVHFENLALYRTSRSTYPAHHAIEIEASHDISFTNLRAFSISRLPFDNAIVFPSVPGLEVRPRIFNSWSFATTQPTPQPVSALLHKRVAGLLNLSSLTASNDGTLSFLDVPSPHVYRWKDGKAQVLDLTDIEPQLIYAPEAADAGIALTATTAQPVSQSASQSASQMQAYTFNNKPHKLSPHPIAADTLLLPTAFATSVNGLPGLPVAPKGFAFPGGVTLPVSDGEGFFRGIGGFAPCKPGQTCYLASDSEVVTYTFQPNQGAKLSPFLQRGGDTLLFDPSSNTLFLANGDLYLYSPTGDLLGSLHAPERITSLALTGHTLFLSSRTSLYSLDLPIPASALHHP